MPKRPDTNAASPSTDGLSRLGGLRDQFSDSRACLVLWAGPAAGVGLTAASALAGASGAALGVAVGLSALLTAGSVWLGRRRLAELRLIGTALDALGGGETDPEALLITPTTGGRAAIWNGLIARTRENDSAERRRQADQAAGAVNQGAATLGESLDALWFGLVMLDELGVVCYANGAARAMLSSGGDDLVEREFAGVIGNDSAGEAALAVANGEEPRRAFEFSRPCSDAEGATGSVLRVTARRIRRTGRASALVIIEDLTQQRAAEAARRGMVDQATHELRTPLTNIRLYVEEAIENGEDDEGLRARALDVISQESRRLERVVSDMLSVSEMESGSINLRIADVRLEPIMRDLETDFAAQAQNKSVELSFELPPKYPVAAADRDKLVLAIHNIIGNAIKYTPAGGRVEVQVRAGEELEIRVVDTGPGIPEDEQEKVFERFYRAAAARRAGEQGTGLGLSLAREIARKHGGDVTLESREGQGCTVTLRAPIVRERKQAA